MKCILLGILVMVLLPAPTLLADGTACVSGVVSKKVQIGEKQATLKAAVDADRGLLQIYQQERATASDTNVVVAEIMVKTLGQCGFDFAMTPTGDILWVFVQQMWDRQPTCLIYPLVQQPGNKGKYIHRMKTMQAAGKHRDFPVLFNLTARLRNLSIGYSNMGKPLNFGRESHIANVQLDSTNAASVVVTGKIGSNYTFRGTVMLNENDGIVTKDFAIELVGNKPLGDSK